jgi:hypothetical protein
MMDMETLNEYLFADLVTQWAARIALSRSARAANTQSSDAALSVTMEDLQAALAQLELRRGVVRALRDGGPTAAP